MSSKEKIAKKKLVKKDVMPWVEKYRPKTLKDIEGIPTAKKKLISFLNNFPNIRAAVLIGPPGVGKTTLAYAVAHDKNYDIVEMNASDARSADAIKKKIQETTKSRSITDFMGISKGKIILIDEVDGLHGNQDRGGIPTLLAIIERTQYPIIMTCNEWLSKLSRIYKISEMIKFQSIRKESIKKVLNKIVEKETISDIITQNIIEEIAGNARGDLRSAINDLETVSKRLGRSTTKESDTIEQLKPTRDEFLSIFQGTTEALQGKEVSEIKKTISKIDMPNVTSAFHWDTILGHLLENFQALTKDQKLLIKSTDLFAEADKILGYVKMNQDWSLLSYFIDFISAAVALINNNPGDLKKFNQKVNRPEFRFYRDSSPKEVIGKVSKTLEISDVDVKREILPVVKEMVKQKKGNFSDDFLDWMELETASRNKVLKWLQK
ncbi:MAG: replication factor C large subunit [Candidatus Hodarchaeota archaeon]